MTEEPPKPGFGDCRCVVCPYPAATQRWGMCDGHQQRLFLQGGTGQSKEALKTAMPRWVVEADPLYRFDVINLRGLPAMVRAEFKLLHH